MKTPDIIASKLSRFPKGYVFTYLDFITEVESKEALIKSLNRLAESGRIAKLSKGKFYKPEPTPFGDLKPSQYQIVKDLLEDDGKITGYLTGTSIYNELGLTTQVGNTIQIGSNNVRPRFKRERYTISLSGRKISSPNKIYPCCKFWIPSGLSKRFPIPQLLLPASVCWLLSKT